MPPTDKKLEKLQKLLEIANEDYTTPEDLIKMSEAILSVVTSEKKRIDTEMSKHKGAVDSELKKSLTLLSEKEAGLQALIKRLHQESLNNTSEASKRLSDEIKRVERKIPSKTDLSGIEADIKALSDGLNSLPTEITMNNEAIRDGLELLQGDERLDKSAIKGLDELVEELKKGQMTNHVAGVRFLSYLADVNIAGITDGQTLVWDTTTGKFIPGTAGGGSGTGDFLADGSVPMTGDLNLNGNNLDNTNLVQFDTTRTGNVALGELAWDDDKNTFVMGIDGTSVSVNQNFWYVRNNTGSTLTKGTPVYASGTVGASGRITVAPMIADGSIESRYLLGVLLTTVTNGNDGLAISTGTIRQLDTSAWADGTVLYVDPNTAGLFTSTEPTAPDLSLPIAFVVHSSATVGEIAVRVSPLDENAYAPLSHTHAISDVTGLQTALDGKSATSHTHTASQITDFDTEVSNNTDVAANTAARHSAVTVTDSTSIDLTLTGQDITAQREALTGAITASKNSNTTALGSFTKAQLDAAVSDGNVMYVGDAPTAHTHTLANVTDVTMTVANLNSLDDGVNSTLHFHDADRSRANHTGTQTASTISDFNEAAQDAVGGMVDTTLVYSDATPSLSRAALTGAITVSAGSNTTALGSFTKSQLDAAVSDGNVLYVGDVTTNATHTGEVTGSGALTVDKTAITNKTLVTAAVGDHILIADASDTDNLKKVTVQTIVDLAGGGGVSDGDKGDITVSGSGTVWTADPTLITGKGTVTVASGDYVLISDTSDSGNLKKVLASDLTGGGGGGLTEAQVRTIARRYAVAL